MFTVSCSAHAIIQGKKFNENFEPRECNFEYAIMVWFWPLIVALDANFWQDTHS